MGGTCSDPSKAFVAQAAKARWPIHLIMGKGQKTDWYSPTATSASHACVDLMTLTWAKEENAWDKLDDLWWSCLFRCRRLAFRMKGHEDDWFISMGDEVHAIIGWPLVRKEHSLGAYNYFTLDAEADPVFLHCPDPSAFEGCSEAQTYVLHVQ